MDRLIIRCMTFRFSKIWMAMACPIYSRTVRKCTPRTHFPFSVNASQKQYEIILELHGDGKGAKHRIIYWQSIEFSNRMVRLTVRIVDGRKELNNSRSHSEFVCFKLLWADCAKVNTERTTKVASCLNVSTVYDTVK